MEHLKYLNKYFYRYRIRFIFGILFVTASNIFGVFTPRVVRHAFNMVESNGLIYRIGKDLNVEQYLFSIMAQGLLVLALLILFLAIMKGIFMFFMRQTLIVMSRKIEYDLKNAVYEKYQQLDSAFFKRSNTGDLMNRATEDVSRVRMYIGPAIMYSINLIVLFVITIIAMLSVSPKLTLFAIMPLPFLSVSIYFVNRIINRKSEEIQRYLSRLTSIAQEVFSGIQLVKAYVHEKTFLKYFEKEAEEYRIRSLSLAKVEALFFPLMLLLVGLSTIITIYVGGQEVMKGTISAGNIAEFVIYINMLTWPVTSIGWVAAIIQRAAASQQRINEFLNQSSDIDDGAKLADLENDSLKFEHVSFTYPDTGIEAIKDVSFTLKPGQKVAIVGRTGSGKSTIAQLVTRRYDLSKGYIKVGNHDLSDLKLEPYLSQLAYVPQDIFLFSDTVSNNVSFSQDDSTLEEIQEAAENASIRKEIEDFGEGYETFIGERGVTLSGGQKQRISIARAMFGEPKMIILDDCLSAVDAQTEQQILSKLNIYLKDRTAIVITHRIFTLLEFDQILVLDEGELKEKGTHEELLSLKGIYADLFRKQQLEEEEV